MEIKTIDIGKLKPFEGNPKKHPKEQIDKIIKSFGEFGWTNPVLVTKDNMIIAGHARVEAAKKAKIKKVPVIYLPFDGKKALMYAVADNKLAELADWDFSKLADLMVDLDSENFDLELTGFDMSEIEELMNWTPKEEEPFDAAAEAEKIKEPKSKRGQIYQLGRHRLGCLDATNKEDIAKLMNGEKANILLCDPLYGMDLDTDFSGAIGSLKSIGRKNKTRGNKYEPVIGDDKSFDPMPFLRLFDYIKEQFWFGADYYAERITGKNEGSWLVWDKRKESQAEAIGSEFELIWSKNKHKRRMLRHDWFGFLSSRNQKEARDRLHPTQKPTSLLIDIMEQWGKKNDIVLDLFGGSGSTLIACEQLNRQCRMMEIDETYCDVIIKRFEQFSGEKAELIK